MTVPQPATLTLDHVGVGVRDLDVAQQTYQRLGFRLTRRALLLTRGTAAGTWQPSGASNHCAVFHQGYVELVSITDPSRGNKFADEIERHEGLHIVALGAPSADRAWRELAGRGIEASRPEFWGREVFGNGAPDVARFKFTVVPRAVTPEGVVIAVEHLTPEKTRTPDLMEHPNGVVMLLEVMLCVEDLEDASRRYHQVLGVKDSAFGPGRAITMSVGRLVLVDQAAREALYPGVRFPAPPSLVGFTVKVRNLRDTWDYLTAVGISPGGDPERGFWVGPDATHGTAIRFYKA